MPEGPPPLPPQPDIYKAAEDTYVIPNVLEAPPIGLIYFNTLVIRGKEPTIVDTGAPIFRQDWLSRIGTIVDLDDVKWIFLSHDDRDHSGNVVQALAACPNATLLTTWFSVGRMADEWSLPPHRIRFLYDGESLDVGDRTFGIFRPPFFDSPVTLSLFDSLNKLYWSVDTFATNMSFMPQNVEEIKRDEWREGVFLANRLNHPWHEWLDKDKWFKVVDRVQSLGIETVAGCHTPMIKGPMIEDAFKLIRQIPDMEPWSQPSQAEFEALVAAMMADPPPQPSWRVEGGAAPAG